MKLCAALLCLLLSCGGSDSLALDAFVQQQAAALGKVSTCLEGQAPEYVPARGASDADLKKAIAAGRVKYDAVLAKSCADALAAPFAVCWGADAPQRGPAPSPAACLQVFTGTVADGAACYLGAECASGECTLAKGACPGACAKTLASGADCSGAGVCARGLICGQDSGTCQSPGAAGAACVDSGECVTGLRCSQGHCALPLTSGAACAPPNGGEDPCGDGLYCPGNSCQSRVDTGVACTTPATPLSLASRQCKGNQMCVGATRDAKGNLLTSGHCGAPQDVGFACVRPANGLSSPLSVGCYIGLVCDPATSRCALAPRAGSPCIDGLCDPLTAYCSNSNCLAQVNDGAACSSRGQCHQGSDCVGSVCTAPAAAAACHEP
jgi:hypothetical protein